MGRWFRVFAAEECLPGPAEILDHFRSQGVEASGEFDQDAGGWYAAVLVAAAGQLRLERFGADEEGVRAELNSWAAWLETCGASPLHVSLMERIIQTRQLVTVRGAASGGDDAMVDRWCKELCRFLGQGGGLWQADGEGLFSADGRLLVEEQ